MAPHIPQVPTPSDPNPERRATLAQLRSLDDYELRQELERREEARRQEALEQYRAYLATLPVSAGVMLIKRCAPIGRYRADWVIIQTDSCPHCGRSHCTTVTGAARPRREKIERARNGGHIGRCPYRGWREYRVEVRDERI